MRDLHDTSVLCAVHGHPHAARLVARGLRALVDRTRATASGIAVAAATPRSRRGAGLAPIEDEAALEALGGPIAVGELHDAAGFEATLGLVDAPGRPVIARVADGWAIVAANGRAPAHEAIVREILQAGVALQGETPAHLLMALLARARQRTTVNRLVEALWRMEGAHAFVIATPTHLIGVRDPHGLRPLVLGTVDGATVLASDEAAVFATGGAVVRGIEPGEMVVVDEVGTVSLRPFASRAPSPCAQEAIQLASDGSTLEGRGVWGLRVRLGEELARERPALVDVVVASDAGSRPAAAGFARGLGVPEVAALIEAPSLPPRAVADAITGRRVALVGIGLGEGLRARVAALLLGGAAEVHVRAVAPPRVRACLYGLSGDVAPMDTEEVLAGRLGAASVAWTSAERLAGVLRVDRPGGWCTGCLGGAWPIPPESDLEQLPLFT